MSLRRKLLFAIVFASGLDAATAVEVDPVRQTALNQQLARIAVLRSERPRDGMLVFVEAMTLSQLGRRELALSRLSELRDRGLGLLPTQGGGFDDLWADAEFQALRRQLADEQVKTADAPVHLRLDDPRLIPEGIAYDAKRRRYFIGSIAQKKIVSIDVSGQASDFSQPDDQLDQVLGLRVDGARDWLYAISTGVSDAESTGPRRNKVLRYRLSDGRLDQRFDVADAVQLNDVTTDADGNVYCTDSGSGTLYKMAVDATSFERFGDVGGVRGANGLAVAADGTLYVTLSLGIARLDPRTGAAERLPQPDDVVSGGIDGLYWKDGALLGIQNWTNPGRVIRLELAADGKRISALRVLQSHHHGAFAEPTTGVIVGDKLMVIANSHVAQYQAGNGFKNSETLRPTEVIAVPLR
ncbi:SMP-30/gluconolactonase/LRE family protein [Pseudomarimonas arenosa]|uniref:SMP-30/Gluconolactonase/LRE-like region domain-containing protein n=1 Tax=Pseudomarimonas arenosa TaxID=2774145 RepID=A0AAW3ZS64_9GAMM|nr:hypothetical protein [Pseudomarimonas arenosa]MBD8527066.1 hypothetical protein [Pseudomarimonas arenosa]